MTQTAFPFIGGAYAPRSKSSDVQRCVNLYPEVSQAGPTPSKAPIALIGTPGLAPWIPPLAVGSALGIRGMLRFDTTRAIIVAGTNVYLVLTNGVSTLLGTIPATSALVSLASNGTQVLLADGTTTVRVYEPASGGVLAPTEVNGATGPVAVDTVDFLAGRFVVNEKDTGRFRWSDLYATTFPSLNFATAEGAPDGLVTLVADHGELWLLGTNSAEVFYASGDAAVFSRNNGAFTETGCAARATTAKMAGAVYWLSANDRGRGRVVRSNGYQAAPISTHALEHAIAGYARVDDAHAYTYQQEGHEFYVLTFPSGNSTWVFDAGTELWHERAYRDPTTAVLERHRGQCQMAFDEKVLVGDHTTGNVYAMGLDTYSDNGAPLPRIRQCGHVSADMSYMRHNSLHVDFDTGVGLDGSPPLAVGVTPQAMMQHSSDGGRTWSSEHWVSFGALGQYRARAKWRRLGTARDRVYRVTVTDPVKVCMASAYLDAQALGV